MKFKIKDNSKIKRLQIGYQKIILVSHIIYINLFFIYKVLL